MDASKTAMIAEVGRFVKHAMDAAPIDTTTSFADVRSATANIRDNFQSAVLATIMAPGWQQTYLCSIGCMLARFIQQGAKDVFLVAVKGGPVCDDEIRMIGALIKEMGGRVTEGFSPTVEAEGYLNVILGVRLFPYEIPREGMDPVTINLHVYDAAENVSNEMALKTDLKPFEDRPLRAPYLKRVAIVSCPLHDLQQGDVHEKLNRAILDILSDGATASP
eukprot:TRINITY_DN37820_c0_g1_i1.p1 TRINITY_DN37820_c0_g1~~TRINITY_DN37820_c0_g1_i1.p1  ORF type:complete len:220 (-),score=38.40 TRINITY_DN37820_c0_g1_i1:164-823(-)